MVESAQTIIIDNGSGMMKAGFAGEEGPRAVFPTIVGRPKTRYSMRQGVMHESEYNEHEAYSDIQPQDDFWSEVMAKRDILNFSYPIASGSLNHGRIWRRSGTAPFITSFWLNLLRLLALS